MSKFKRLGQMYHYFVDTYPVLSQSCQAAVVVTSGDLLAQFYIERRKIGKDYSLRRTLEFTGLGFFYVAPLQTIWYRILYRYVGSDGGTKTVIKKVAADQLICAPFFGYIFLLILGTLQWKTVRETFDQANSMWFEILINNYKVWPLAQFINFTFIPLKFQVLYAQMVCVFWNTYVSWRTHWSRNTENEVNADEKIEPKKK